MQEHVTKEELGWVHAIPIGGVVGYTCVGKAKLGLLFLLYTPCANPSPSYGPVEI